MDLAAYKRQLHAVVCLFVRRNFAKSKGHSYDHKFVTKTHTLTASTNITPAIVLPSPCIWFRQSMAEAWALGFTLIATIVH